MAKIALLIGVSEYEAGFDPLPAAVRDIAGLRDVLLDPEMGGFDEVTVLPNPQRQEMEESIYKLFDQRQKEDLLLLYFSGHGVVTDYGKFFLSTRVSRLEQRKLIPTSAVDCTMVHEWMEQSRSRRQVVILDSCFSGAFAKGLTAKGSLDLQKYLGGEGRAILTAATSMQYAFEQSGSEFSLYTRYLIEGMRTGAADLNDDGEITIDELHQYTRNKVHEAAPAMTPEFYPTKEAYRIILGRSPKNDPKLKYRKEVESRANQGKFSVPARRLLNSLRSQLNITAADAKAIEAEVLQPFLKFQGNLAEYEHTLIETLKVENFLSERVWLDLQDYQKHLSLRDEDVAEIHARLLTTQPMLSTETSTFEFEVVTVDSFGKEIERRRDRAPYFVEDLNGIPLEMVAIPGGTFEMGSKESEKEQPIHTVTVHPFYMSKFPITQAQYEAIMGQNPSHFKGPNRPVEKVSWNDAVEFCDRLSQKTGTAYRLPSEAEWEYACRAGTETPFYFGETITTNLANYDGNYTYGNGPKGIYRKTTTDVGTFPANAFGLSDMHGNVWEWCADPWHENYQNAPTDGSVWQSDSKARVRRGGSWDNNPRGCRSAFRSIGLAEFSYNYIGFRVVCIVPRAS